MPQINTDVALFFLGGIFAVLWWLLRNKDARQEKSIEILFKKHDTLEGKISGLALKIAENHYQKPELDTKLEKLETSIRDGMKDVRDEMKEMGTKFDRLGEILIKALTKGEKNGSC